MEEKLRILKMVEEGKLTAEQAVELLKALEGTAPEQETTDSAESFYEETHAVPENIPYENKMSSILECIDNETLGNIIEVSSSDGTTVRIFIG